MKKADVTVFAEPSYIEYDCPHCDAGIMINYDEFNKMMNGEYWADWEEKVVECDACKEKFEIGEVETSF